MLLLSIITRPSPCHDGLLVSADDTTLAEHELDPFLNCAKGAYCETARIEVQPKVLLNHLRFVSPMCRVKLDTSAPKINVTPYNIF